MPAFQETLAVIVCRLRRVTEAVGRITVHTGLARNRTKVPALRLVEEGLDAFGVDRAVAGHCGRAVGQRDIEEPARDLGCILGVTEAHFLREGVGVQPIDQPFAPAGDDRGLGIMHVGVYEPGQDQAVAIICDRDVRMGARQVIGRAECRDAPVLDQHASARVVPSLFRPADERIAREVDRLADQKLALSHPMLLFPVLSKVCSLPVVHPAQSTRVRARPRQEAPR